VKIDIDLLPNELLTSEFSGVESSHLITNGAASHGKFDFDAFSAGFASYFEDVAIKDIADLPNEVVLGVDEAENLRTAAEHAQMSLIGSCLGVEVVLSSPISS
jgi:hypothetical protein